MIVFFSEEEFNNVVKKALEFFGEESQIDKFIEESAELTQALLKNRKAGKEHPGTLRHVYEELADVLITLMQLTMIYSDRQMLEHFVNEKIARLSKMLPDEKNEKPEDNVLDSLLERVFSRGMEFDIIGTDEMRAEIEKIKSKFGY